MSKEITRKNRLWKNVQQSRQRGTMPFMNDPSADFDFLPRTFFIPSETDLFLKEFADRQSAASHTQSALWIVKPIASSRGRGIRLIQRPEDLPTDRRYVVSEYIASPYLINGLKFDLRIYVTVTSFSPLQIYVHDLGFGRFASQPYSADPAFIENRFMHLTNYSVNKNNQDFVANEDAEEDDVGHKWSLPGLIRHLAEVDGVDVVALQRRIDILIVRTIMSVEETISSALDRKCFELYGFDVLLDSNLQPWLMEVNLTPSLLCDTPIDVKVKGAVISDLLTLVGIPRSARTESSPERLGGYRRVWPPPLQERLMHMEAAARARYGSLDSPRKNGKSPSKRAQSMSEVGQCGSRSPCNHQHQPCSNSCVRTKKGPRRASHAQGETQCCQLNPAFHEMLLSMSVELESAETQRHKVARLRRASTSSRIPSPHSPSRAFLSANPSPTRRDSAIDNAETKSPLRKRAASGKATESGKSQSSSSVIVSAWQSAMTSISSLFRRGPQIPP